ncbi:MAG: FAD-linked oxidase C-terminal domain-containing protein, partial [Fidelibacterota bacterium]
MDYSIGDKGRKITLQPGLVGDLVNRYLKPFRRRIGPDPASIKAARIGGIINNNASGMCCGTAQNSYHTLESIRFILANGHGYDTGNPEDYTRFLTREKALVRGLLSVRDKITASGALTRKIREKYKIKNTLGYSMNALLDFTHPLDIFAHLLVGSEGTLAFVSQVCLQTVPDPPEKLTGLVLFPNLRDACSVIPALVDTGAKAVELMDYSSLTTAKYLRNPPYDVTALDSRTAALLIEYQGESHEALTDLVRPVTHTISGKAGNIVGGFQANEDHRAALWQIRKGLYPTVGSLRKKGTSVITEDIAYPLVNLPEVIDHLHGMFRKWKFEDAVVFGHAKDGNLHFVTSIDLDSTAGVANYDGLMNDLVDLTTVKYPGSLKAEHGTGRNMAPFIEAEWGGELTSMMWEIKQSADPKNILNPGVLLNRDAKIHLKNLKPMPLINEIVDQCVECGFCEPVCPSAALTTTPRQRIVLAREIELRKGGDERRELQHDFRYAVMD